MRPPRSTTWFVGALATLLAAPVAAQSTAKPQVFSVRGTDTERGAFTATVTVEQLPKGEVLVTRDVAFAKGDPERLVGKGAWTKNKLEVQLRPVTKGIIPAFERTELVAGRRNLVLTLDRETGFCIERSATRTASSRAQGKVDGAVTQAPTEHVSQDATGDDGAAGWTIKVPGDLADAAQEGERIYVAAGAAGLQVVDLETEAVVGSVALPGEATEVAIQHGKASVALVTTVNRGERWITRVALPALKVLSTARQTSRRPAHGQSKRPKGDLDVLRCRAGVYALRATEVVQYGPAGTTSSRTPLGATIQRGSLISVRNGTAALAIPGRGVVLLDLAPARPPVATPALGD